MDSEGMRKGWTMKVTTKMATTRISRTGLMAEKKPSEG
jgi:hypothetical protein